MHSAATFSILMFSTPAFSTLALLTVQSFQLRVYLFNSKYYFFCIQHKCYCTVYVGL